jgi:cell division protein FtsB
VADRKRTAHRKTPQRAGTKRRPSTRSTATPARNRRRVLVRVLLGGMVVVALLFAFVFPARTLLAQRQRSDEERDRLELLREQTHKLQQETIRLQDNAEIERIAREQYGFLLPGERPYVVVPPPTSAPPSAPPTTSGSAPR